MRISMRCARVLAALLPVLFLMGCAAERIFYYPNTKLYGDPQAFGLAYDIVEYPSLNGAKLTALYFKTANAPKGTIVHLHGNFGNMSNHFPQAVFLLKNGFDVLIPDYEGFGASQGRPSPKNTVDDARASVRYARDHLRNPGGGVGIFGQSLGAAVGAVAAAEEPEVKAVVLEAPFNSYKAITRDVMRRSWVTWPLCRVFPALFVRHRFDAEDYVGRISPRPLFIIHGTADRTVPYWMSEALYKKAGEPRRLWLVEHGDHLALRRAAGAEYEEEIARFFTEALTGNSGR